jgi:hypothetical protein
VAGFGSIRNFEPHEVNTGGAAMAKPRADETDVHEAEEFLATREGVKHIPIRKRADLLILESGCCSG